jgi:hypothetical protein
MAAFPPVAGAAPAEDDFFAAGLPEVAEEQADADRKQRSRVRVGSRKDLRQNMESSRVRKIPTVRGRTPGIQGTPA